MSPPSSISSSEGRRYALTAAATATFVALLFMAGSFLAMHYRWVSWHFAQLYDYQADKIAGAAPIDVLLVGDSSLGNAIDARRWSAELHRPVVSAALTGVYGYAGSLNMMRRALRRHAVSTVIIMQTADMMTRPDSDQGLLYTAETWGDLRGLTPAGAFRALGTLDIVLHAARTLLKGRSGLDPAIAARDYVPQGPALPTTEPPPRGGGFSAAWINPGKAAWLHEIASFCREKGIRCLYAHGPLTASRCRGSDAYFRRVAEIIAASGLRLVRPEPVCIPWEDTGDSTDHVAPARREHYSDLYLSLIAPLLAPPR